MFTEVQAQYRPSRDFEFAIGMRDIIRNDNTGAEQGIVHQFRLHFDAALVMKIYQFDLTNRLRYQRRNEIGKSRAEGDHPIKDYRWKSTLVWNLENTKWKPKASAEFFYHAGIGELNGLRTVRYAIGADYRINKRQKLSFQYRRETDVVVWNPEVSHIFFVRYIHTIRKPKKKKAP